MFKNNFRKIDLIKNLSSVSGLSMNLSKKLIDDIIVILLQNIKTGNFTLKNVGTFNIIFKRERIGRNPKTKKEFIITARKSISFTPSENINKKLNYLV